MKYLKLIDGNRQSNTFGNVQGLIRYSESRYEYYNRGRGEWVEKPDLLLDVTGLGGGGHDYRDSTEAEANLIIDQWNKRNSV